MNPNDLIGTYVEDVARRLPRRLRGDVALELRSLLREELSGHAADAGRMADEAMAMDLLRDFGAPADVADRYRPAGFTIIKPTDAPGFALTALAGVALQWVITLSLHFANAGSAAVGLQRLGGWWLTFGLTAFWWPGLLVCIAIVAAWPGHRPPLEERWTPVRVIDRDQMSRLWLSLGLALWIAGATFWVGEPWLVEQAPPPVAAALRLDPTFLHDRAAWLLPLWAAQFLLHGVVIWAGRWSRTTRRLNALATVAICLLLTWFLLAGPVFTAAPTDRTAKLIVAIIVIASLAAEALRFAGTVKPSPGREREGPAPSGVGG